MGCCCPATFQKFTPLGKVVLRSGYSKTACTMVGSNNEQGLLFSLRICINPIQHHPYSLIESEGFFDLIFHVIISGDFSTLSWAPGCFAAHRLAMPRPTEPKPMARALYVIQIIQSIAGVKLSGDDQKNITGDTVDAYKMTEKMMPVRWYPVIPLKNFLKSLKNSRMYDRGPASFSSFFIGRDVSKVEQEIEKDVGRVEQEEMDIRATIERVGRSLSQIEARMEKLERKEQQMSKVERRIERDFDRVQQKDTDLRTTMDQIGTSLSRIESRLETLERKLREVSHRDGTG